MNDRATVLPPHARHPRELGHGGQRPVDGVRQHGRRLRHRRRLHPQPVDRRERVLRRVPDQRPGRGRGRRHPHAAAPDRSPARRRSKSDAAVDGRGDAGGLRAAARRSRPSSRRHYRDMQDIEFTVEQGKLYMLQTRNGKRTAKAALKVAVDMAREGLITSEEAVLRVEPASLDQLLHPTLDPKAPARGDRHGPAGLARRGRRARSCSPPTRPRSAARAGEAVILVRDETSPRTSTACTPPRHPHRARRHDQPRRGGRPRHGPALRLRRRRAAASTPRPATMSRARHDGARPATSSPSTAPPARSCWARCR